MIGNQFMKGLGIKINETLEHFTGMVITLIVSDGSRGYSR